MKLCIVIEPKKLLHYFEYFLRVSYLPGLWYLLMTVLAVVLADPESPKCQRNSAGSGASATARKVTSVFVG